MARCPSASGAETSTRWMYRVSTDSTCATRSRMAARTLSSRKSDSAGAPLKVSMSEGGRRSNVNAE